MEEKYVILYHNGEYEISTVSLSETIEHLKSDRRYKNYGHNGAIIVPYKNLYSITAEGKIEPIEEIKPNVEQ